MVDKIPENQLKAINQAKADGISAEERKALEMQGVNNELLEALSGTKSSEEVDNALKNYQEEPGFFEKAWGWTKENPVKTVATAAAVALSGWGLVAALGIKGAVLGLGALGAGAFFTSCAKEEVPVAGNTTNFFNNLNIYIEQATDPELKKSLESINDRLERIETNQEQGNKYLNQIVSLLTSLVAKVTNIEAKGEEHTKLLTKILDCLNSHMTGTAENFDKLYAYLNKLNSNIETMDSNCAKYHEKILEKLDTLNGNVENMSAENKEFYNFVVDKLSKMEANDVDGLKAIMSILNNFDELNATVREGFKNVLNGQKLTNEQLNTIINNQEIQKSDLDEIKALIMKNNEITKGTKDALDVMSQNMSSEHQAILDAIKNVQAGGGDYGDLKAILEQVRDNTSVLPDINKQLNLVGTAIEKLLEEVQGMRAETQKGLLEILAKIPNGCNCQELDLSGILAKLDELLAEVRKDPNDTNNDNEHEGIIKDLEDYFG